MRMITIAALAALSLNAHSIEYVPDPDVAFDIIQMHDTTTWERVCQSFDGVCDVPEGTYQVKLLDRNWNELVRLREVRVQGSAEAPDLALDICILYAQHPQLPAPEYCPAPTYEIGDTGPGGGIVFYLDGSGGGLEAAKSDQSITAWGCDGLLVGTSTVIGSGQSNTDVIIDACTTEQTAAGVAKTVGEGWFLPSKDALTQMYIQRDVVGGFDNVNYWSSSEFSATSVWGHGSFITNSLIALKTIDDKFRVRAVRAF